MKRMLINTAIAIVFGLCIPANALTGTIDELTGIVYPELDFKYVQYLPSGHLHKNKPRYGKYNWRVLESRHFLIYTYGSPRGLDELYLAEAEKVYKEYSDKFQMNAFSEKIKVIVYNSTRDFEETNLLPGLIPQGLGGFTESIKRKRVVIAFRNSLFGFKRLLRHELAHRYQVEFLKLSLSGFAIRGAKVPLWFMEGDAERRAHQWEAYGEMIMRYCYLNNHLASVTKSRWPTTLVYKQGEFILNYLVEKYGEDAVNKIFLKGKKIGFKKAFKEATGKSLKEFDKELKQHIEERYGDLRTKTDITDYTRVIDNDAVLLATRNNFFLTRKMVFGRSTLFINWTDGKNIYFKKLVEDGRLKNSAIRGLAIETSPEFGFHEHGASFGSDTTIVYSIERNGRDEIRIQHFFFDKEEKRFSLGNEEIYSLKAIRDIQYPIMISEDEIAFVGRKSVFSEIFLFNRRTKELKQLTLANRNYRGLTYSESLHALVTSVENDETQSYDLALGDLSTGKWRLLTETAENEFSQEFSLDGTKLLYTSDKDLVYNVYLYDFKTKLITPLTDVKVGVFRPKWFGENGILFNNLDETFSIRMGQLPTKHAALSKKSKCKAKTEKDSDLKKRFLELLPGADSLTVMNTIISSDKTKVLFVVNRRLSLEKLSRHDPELKFYLMDLTKETIVDFAIDELDQINSLGHAEFLAGTNILLQKSFRKDGTKLKLFVYDWNAKELHALEGGGSRFSLTILSFKNSTKSIFRISPNKNFILLISGGKLTFYDVLFKKSTQKKEFGKVIDAMFTSDCRKLMVLSKLNGHGLVLHSLDLLNKAHIENELEFVENLVSWYLLPDGSGIFFVSKSWSGDKYNIWLLKTEKKTTTLVRSNLPVVKKAEIKDRVLKVETENTFGIKRTLAIDQNGKVVVSDELTPYMAQKSYPAICAKTPLKERMLKIDREIPKRLKKPSRFPKFYTGMGGGSISLGGSFAVFSSVLAFDDLNDRMYVVNTYLKNATGFADVRYYDFSTGRSYTLDYWHFNQDYKRLGVGASQNIFLDKFLNWDVTLREEYVKVFRIQNDQIYTRKWLQTKLGTTFSLDTTMWNQHGPHSGNAVFTGMEIGMNSSMGFQCLDVNLDARRYLPFGGRSGLAFRLAGGHSFGPTPTTFIWGGNQTFRGIPLFSQSGDSYVLQSSELRFPIFDVIGAQTSGSSRFKTRMFAGFMDVRGGIYNDIGDIWYSDSDTFAIKSGNRKFKTQYSTGFFVNAPIGYGVNLRFNKGIYGKKGVNFWIGYNW